jgi:transglycosylase-like protein with SLT domain
LRLKHITLLAPLALLAASELRAEYVVLRSGERLHVTGYQLLGDKYRLQMAGGWVEVRTGDVVSIEPEEVFTPVPAQPSVVAPPYRELVAAAASRYGVDAELITSVIAVESNFDPKAVSRKNARGLMQLLPETAARLGIKDIFDPQENIDAGTRYLRELLQMYKNDLALTLAAYNAGPERVQQYGRVPPFAETISYVRRVKRTYEQSKTTGATKPATPSGTTKGASPGATPGPPAVGPPSPAPRTIREQ